MSAGETGAGETGTGETGTGPGRRLILLRHAKSDWPQDVADHERPLAARGRRDAPVIGRWLAGEGLIPGAVLCSTARRARETWSLVTEGLAAGKPAAELPQARPEPRVYEATALSLLMLVRELDPRWGTVLIVGHNPGLAELTIRLAGDQAAPEAFPTAFTAVLALPGDWAAAAPGEGRLLAFTAPKLLRP